MNSMARIAERALLLLAFCAMPALAWAQGPAPSSGEPPPAYGLWTGAEWERARSLSPLLPPPLNPTNALGDDIEAARLGHELFFDKGLSPRGFSCASCHKPELGFTDGLRTGNTIEPLERNVMTVLNTGHYRWLTWDGARDSLWHQAVVPVESPVEMASSRLYVVKHVMRRYGPRLRKLARLPDGWEALWPKLPEAGKPGDLAYDGLTEAQKRAVDTVFTTVLKVIAAYERRLASGLSPFDRFVAGEKNALSVAARRGFQHFLRFGCDICHNTPLFSDDEFHNLGLASDPVADPGRLRGLETVKQSPFRGTGRFADAEPFVRPEDYRSGASLEGAFRTPSLRELEKTAPYGHNGSVATLENWLDHYVAVTSGEVTDFVGRLDDALPTLRPTDAERRELIAFLRSLGSDYASEWTREPGAGPR